MWLPWQALIPAVLAAWLGPNIGRTLVEDYSLFNSNMMRELPGLLGLAAFSSLARVSLRELEEEHMLLGLRQRLVLGIDPHTGVFEESQLRISIEAELSRARRFSRSFSLVLVGIDEMRQRFDYRDEGAWKRELRRHRRSLLRGTRYNVDRVYRYGPTGFAMILPESGPKDVNGLVRRLRRDGRKTRPAEGEPGGPLPAYFGATFFPTCATSTDDLLRRAEIALRIADKAPNHVQLDGAEAPEMPAVETLRSSIRTGRRLRGRAELSRRRLPSVPAKRRPSHPGQCRRSNEEPPLEVYALRAPEPAVDEYAHDLAGGSASQRHPAAASPPHLVAVDSDTPAPEQLDDSVAHALKRSTRRSS